jgi:hypothetical protein
VAFPIASKTAKPDPKSELPRHAPGNKGPTVIEIEPIESGFGKILKRPGE